MPAHRIGGRVGAPDDHGAGGTEIGDDRVVALGDKVAIGLDPAIGRMALLVDIAFDRDRNAMERGEPFAARPHGIGGVGIGERLGIEAADDGVERAVDSIHARKTGGDRLAARNSAETDQPRELASVEPP
jgi:hypothetical protein